MKKIAVVGILVVLIVVGCVLSAGCTSSSSIFVSEDKIIGTWSDTNSEYGSDIQQTYIFRPGGMGVEYKLSSGEYMMTKMFTWQKFDNADCIQYNINYINGGTCSFTYNYRNDTLTSSEGNSYSRVDDAVLNSIVGSWIYSDLYMGETITLYMIFKWDNTGLDVERLMNGNTYSYPFTWKKEGDLYKIAYTDGDNGTVILDTDNDLIIYTDDAGMYETTVYKDIDSVGLNPVIGTWVGTNNRDGIPMSYVEIFNPDKTGFDYEIKSNGNKTKYVFHWEEDGNDYIIKYIDGDSAKYTYNSDDDTLIFMDGTVLTRKK